MAGMTSARLAAEDLRRGFNAGLVPGVFVFDAFTVVWVDCSVEMVESIRGEAVFDGEKETDMLL